MKEKSLALLFCIFVLLSISGFIYAQWNDVIVISNTMQFGDLNMGFVELLKCWDNEVAKDVGKYNCYYTDLKPPDIHTAKQAYATLIITISDGYPDYEVHCNFTLENIGTLPLHINETVISDPTGTLGWNPTLSALVDADGKPILTIVIKPDLVCNELWPWDDAATPEIEPVTLEAEIAIQITQNAQKCHIYSFQVKIMYEQVT